MRVLSLSALLLGAVSWVACDEHAASQPQRTAVSGSVSETPALNVKKPEPPPPQVGPLETKPAPKWQEVASPSSAPPRGAISTDGRQVYALTRNVWIRSAPQSDVQWIGSLWLGGSVKVRGGSHVPGAGCADVWVPIEPRGWVCVDDRRATLDPNHPALRRLWADTPDPKSAWPHRYAVVHGNVSRYRLPPEVTPGRAGAAEATLELPFPLNRRGEPDLPPGLYEGRTKIVARSAVAYVRELSLGERTYLLMPDFSFVRRDQVELVPPSSFVGVSLGEELSLPIAFVKGEGARTYTFSPDGDPTPARGPLSRFATLALSGAVREAGSDTYHQLKGSEEWLRAHDAIIPEPRLESPLGDPPPPGRATWIEGSILGGWLVAFEGATPVYATLISAGRGGTPVGERDPVSTASTPTGRFFITGKFRTATMESSTTPIVHGDVPWTQNFSGPHAIHSAYWHDDWGQLKSAGCVNVSPRDGQWLFHFTEPRVPDGWHAVKHVSRDGPATLLILHE